jgi:hypothetical protein
VLNWSTFATQREVEATGIQSSLFEKQTATGTPPPPRGGRVSAVMSASTSTFRE